MEAQLSHNDRPATMRAHRGYNCFIAGKNIRCTFVHNWCNYHLPRSFVWADKNWDELARYIDALTERRVMDAKRWEDAGHSFDVVYEKPTSAAPIGRINPNTLIAILRGELVIEAPLDTVFIFTKHNSRARINAVPMELLTGEVFDQYLRTIQKHTKRPILYCTKGAKFPTDVEVESVQKRTWVNIAHAEEALEMPPRPAWSDEEDVLDEEPSANEELIDSSSLGSFTNKIYKVSPKNGTPFFLLRRWEHDELVGAWTGSTQNGPWYPVAQIVEELQNSGALQ